ncbi:MAG TPA: hypothetical protein VMT12_07805 [Syntrophales bacterium]|nr:hypothetical protein [Syntrophales bacterium]
MKLYTQPSSCSAQNPTSALSSIVQAVILNLTKIKDKTIFDPALPNRPFKNNYLICPNYPGQTPEKGSWTYYGAKGIKFFNFPIGIKWKLLERREQLLKFMIKQY